MPNDEEHKDTFPKDEDFPDDDFLDSDFDHDDDPSFPDEDPKHPLPHGNADPVPQAAVPAHEETESAPEEPPKPVASVEKAPTPKPPSHTAPVEEKDIDSLENMPLTVNVEVSRFSMSFKDLIALQKGNMVDLHASADAAVNLTVNGKIIGKGELLKIGDTLGVRILEMGR